MLTCNLIGAGRLGKNLAQVFTKYAIASIQAICNQSIESSNYAWQELGLSGISCSIEQLPAADITIIACSDDAVAAVARQLAQQMIQPGSYIIHCSGVLNSSVLEPLKQHGCSLASLHPLKSFKAGYLSADAFAEVPIIIEGDEPACRWLEQVLSGLNAQVLSILPEAKALYHAAAVMASNYLVTLAAASEQLMADTGLEQHVAHKLITQLMKGTLANIEQNSTTATALTGPLMRGDIGTLTRHVHAISDPAISRLYKAAGLATLPLTQLNQDKKVQIQRLLTGN